MPPPVFDKYKIIKNHINNEKALGEYYDEVIE